MRTWLSRAAYIVRRPCTRNRPSLRQTRVSSSYHNASRRSIRELLSLPSNAATPSNVIVHGFVRSMRKQKKVAFAAVDDGSSLRPLQAVLDPHQVQSLSTGCAVSLEGKWVPSRNVDQQEAELQVSHIKILGENNALNPIQKKYQTPEFLRTLPHLRSRMPHNALLLRLRSMVISRASRFFEANGFVQTHTPILTSSDCEGAGEVFQVTEQLRTESQKANELEHFFNSPKYLTVSSQLHLEALVQSVGKVWTLSPTFRAEKSDTARHLSEFYMLEAEECYVETLDTIMERVESLIKAVILELSTCHIGHELQEWQDSHPYEKGEVMERIDLQERWLRMIKKAWPRITYHQAMRMIQDAAAKDQSRFKSPVDEFSGLQTEHERFLAEVIGQGGPVFVTDYPKVVKPFYMAPSEGGGVHLGPVETVACFDLLLPEICEVVGGSMREHRPDVLEATMQRIGLLNKTSFHGAVETPLGENRERERGRQDTDLGWYLDLRRYGSVPHGGFGLGFDRFLAYLAGVPNVRDVVAFPRWYGRCTC